MMESVTYRAIIEEGEAKGELYEARKMLLKVGQAQLGKASASIVAAINSMTDIAKLEELAVSSSKAASWQELLGTNSSRATGRRRKKR